MATALRTSARPLDLFTRQYPEVWSLPVDKGLYADGMDYQILGITNLGKNYDFTVNPPAVMPDSARTYTITMQELVLDLSKTYIAREFWTGTFSNPFADFNVMNDLFC